MAYQGIFFGEQGNRFEGIISGTGSQSIGRGLCRGSDGKANAITVTARKLALLVYRALSGKLAYLDPGTTAYLRLNRVRELKSLRNRAKLLGFELVDRSSAEVLLNPVS